MICARWKMVLGCCLAVLCLGSQSLSAEGTQTGTILGRVTDSAAASLPDVGVTLHGAQISRSTITDAEGRFRFPQLPIGSYHIVVDLLGLTAEERDVRVYIGKTTEVTLALIEGQAPTEESDLSPIPGEINRDQIQVLAVAPLIDRFETGVRTSVSRQFLEELPVERFYQSVALLLPGVSGGGDGNPNTSGGLRSSNLFLVDGVDTTDPTTGLFGLNLSYDGVEDVDVTTAAPTVEYGRASGAIINVVTDSGDDRFRGSARLFAEDRGWGADFQAVPGLGLEVEAANEGAGHLDNTFALTLSGPVWRENLWFFGVFEDGNESFSRPTFDSAIWDEDAGVSSGAFKVNWQIGTSSLVGQYTTDDASFNLYSPFNRDPGENRASRAPQRLDEAFVLPLPGDIFAVERRVQKGDFAKLEWNGLTGQALAWSARVATQDRSLERGPGNRRGHLAPHFAATRFTREDDLIFENDYAIFNGITDQGDENRRRRQGNLRANWFINQGSMDNAHCANVRETLNPR